MPKDILEIKNFNAGIIISPDMKDIPVEAAAYSLNLDSVTEDGKLKGVPNDVLQHDATNASEIITLDNNVILILADGWKII